MVGGDDRLFISILSESRYYFNQSPARSRVYCPAVTLHTTRCRVPRLWKNATTLRRARVGEARIPHTKTSLPRSQTDQGRPYFLTHQRFCIQAGILFPPPCDCDAPAPPPPSAPNPPPDADIGLGGATAPPSARGSSTPLSGLALDMSSLLMMLVPSLIPSAQKKFTRVPGRMRQPGSQPCAHATTHD